MLSFLICSVDLRHVLIMLVFEMLYKLLKGPNRDEMPCAGLLDDCYTGHSPYLFWSLPRTRGTVPPLARAAKMGYQVDVVEVVPDMRCERSPHITLAKIWFSIIADKELGSERGTQKTSSKYYAIPCETGQRLLTMTSTSLPSHGLHSWRHAQGYSLQSTRNPKYAAPITLDDQSKHVLSCHNGQAIEAFASILNTTLSHHLLTSVSLLSS